MKKIGGCLVLLAMAAGMLIGMLDPAWTLPAFGGTHGKGAIAIKAEGNPDEKLMQDVRQAADAFDAMLDEMMQAHLHRDIQIYVGADEAVYQHILEREFSLEADDARTIARISGGWTGGKRAITAINGKAGVMADRSDRISTTAHELFHQMQYELSDGNDTDDKALFWLEEGSADYVGALLAERLGGKPAQKWILDVRLELMRATQAAEPKQLQHASLSERKALMRKDLHTYQMADLMTWHLLEAHAKGQETAKLAEYFRQLKSAEDGETAFAAAFGIGLREYLAEFASWWQAEQQSPAKLFFEPRQGVSAATVQAMKEQAEAVQDLFQRRMGTQLHGQYQFILSPDQQDLAKAVQQYCGVTEKKAAELAGSSLWLENGSTVLINMEQLGEPRQQVFTMGVLLMRVMQGQWMGSVNHGIEWLTRGAGYILGVARMGEAGYGTWTQYQRAWIDTLRKAGRMPVLSRMGTEEGYRKTADSLSDDAASLMAEYAAAELVNRYGWQSLAKWQEAARNTGDARRAFRQVFGQSVEVFEDAVQQKIQRLVMYTR